MNLSVAGSWDEAKLEWGLLEIHFEAEPRTCLCGHYPINEICVIRNHLNGNITEVGNVCVNKFLGLPSGAIFAALGRVRQDEENALNPAAIEHAHGSGWISDWDRDFYIDTWRKRVLSEKQLGQRIRINRRVLAAARRRPS